MVQLGRLQGSKDEKFKALVADIRKDLMALVDDKSASKPVLCQAFMVATAVRESELAGRLIGRAITMEGDPAGIDVDVLRNARRLSENAVPKLFVAGLRAVAESSTADRFLRAFADAVETRVTDPNALLNALEAASNDEGSAPFALNLAGRVALGMGNLDKAEDFGRKLLTIRPGSVRALQIMGNVMMTREQYNELLTLYKDAPESITGAGQRVVALLRLKKNDEALELARATRNKDPRSPIAAQILAQTYVELGGKENLRKALAVLSRVPERRNLLHVRARILLELAQDGDATQKERAVHLYNNLLATSRYEDVEAWDGMMTAMRPNRLQEFADFSEKVLRSDQLKLPTSVRAHVHLARGSAAEMLGLMNVALVEYEASAKLDPTGWQARNNAAWHIATIPVRDRLPAAGRLIEEALEIARKNLEIQPADTASLHDTAAEVYAALGKEDQALRHINDALAKVAKVKYVRYATHKARILLRFEKKAEARSLLEALTKNYAGDSTIAAARDLLQELVIAEKEITEDGGTILPDLPDDKKDDEG